MFTADFFQIVPLPLKSDKNKNNDNKDRNPRVQDRKLPPVTRIEGQFRHGMPHGEGIVWYGIPEDNGKSFIQKFGKEEIIRHFSFSRNSS